jgi:hypothetical protein
LPVGHTLSCAAPERDGERETREAERRRFQLLGNAVTTQVVATDKSCFLEAKGGQAYHGRGLVLLGV